MAAVVVGLGTTVGPGLPGNPGDSAPSAAAGSPAETLGTQLASLLEEATELAAGPAPATPSAGAETDPETAPAHWPTEELAAARKVLAVHVDLLTPGAAAASGSTPGASPSGATTPEATPPESNPSGDPTSGADAGTGPAAFAERLAQSANGLLTASLGAPEQLSRSLLLAGTEQALAARDVARAEGGKAAVEALPEVPLDADAAWQAFDAENGSGTGSAPPTDGTVVLGGNGPPRNHGRNAEAAGGHVPGRGRARGRHGCGVPAAYAYQVAGARTQGDAAEGAWEAAADREQLGWRLQSRLPGGVRAAAGGSVPAALRFREGSRGLRGHRGGTALGPAARRGRRRRWHPARGPGGRVLVRGTRRPLILRRRIVTGLPGPGLAQYTGFPGSTCSIQPRMPPERCRACV